jgi:galactitol-specific phosphotransferase system IIB component
LKNAGGQTSSTTGSFTIDEAQERYGIYPTLEQATSGDQAEQLSKSKLIIAQTQLEQQRVENSISLETARYETETFKSSLQQKEHEMAKLRMELEESVLTAKRAHAEAEIKVRHSKIELEHLKDSLSASAAVSDNMYKEKSRSRDDYYDARSAERKDNSEYIKIGAAGLITGLGVWAAMRKYS